jgi:hypothetical protein
MLHISEKKRRTLKSWMVPCWTNFLHAPSCMNVNLERYISVIVQFLWITNVLLHTSLKYSDPSSSERVISKETWWLASSLANLEIPRNLRNTKVYHRIHRSPPSVPVLSHINLVHALPSHCITIYCNIILLSMSRSSKLSSTHGPLRITNNEMRSQWLSLILKIPALERNLNSNAEFESVNQPNWCISVHVKRRYPETVTA